MVEPGQSIGSYRILRKLGEGGMGAVFEGVQDAIERHVAIKVLHPEFAQRQEYITRFFNEARAVNRIAHPGLVQVSDLGQLPDGTAYIVMELLSGESLGSRLEKRSGPLELAPVINLGCQLADALAAAHAKGIIHRDLKPDNVMVVADSQVPGGERAKLLDFGIAKLAAETGPKTPRTRTDALMGTPRYMSPEQCRGAAEVDDKSDVYSLGVMLFQMLSGRLPFDGDGPGEVIAKHIYEAPPVLATLTPGLPDTLYDLVNRLLAKDKTSRPAMLEVSALLDQIGGLLGAPPAAWRASSQEIVPLSPSVPSLGSSTTLSASTGQGRRSPPFLRWAGLGLLGLGIASTAGYVFLREPHARSSAPATPVRWSLRTSPAGALVLRATDGKILGQTPLSVLHDRAPEALQVRLRLDGYQEESLSLPQDRDSDSDLVLRALPARVEPQPVDAKSPRNKPKPPTPRRRYERVEAED